MMTSETASAQKETESPRHELAAIAPKVALTGDFAAVTAAGFLGDVVLSGSANAGVRTLAMRRTQQTHGNQFAQRAISGRFIQCACGGTCEKCRAEEEFSAPPAESSEESTRLVQRQPVDPSTLSTAETNGHSVIPPGSGEPLDEKTRDFMESRFGADLSDVRLHTDTRAAASAEALDANAYTRGRDIYFARGKYAPQTSGGQNLLAHELTHTIQQSEGIAPTTPAIYTLEDVVVGQADDPLEREADRVADAVVSVDNDSSLRRTAAQIAQQRRGAVTRQRIQCKNGDGGQPADNPGAAPPAPTSKAPLAGQDQEDLKTLQEVLSSQNSNDIFKIKNPNVASDDQKIGIIRIACKMNAFLFSAAILSQWWSSFGERLPTVASAYMADWMNSIQVNSGLKYIPQVRKAQDAFLADVGAAATQNLFKNRDYVIERKETLGLQPGSKKSLSEPEKAEWRHQIQDLAWQVWELNQAQAQLRNTIVGYSPNAFAPPSPIKFNPDNPQRDPFEGVHGTRPKWEDLKLAWDLISAEIARIAGKYPEIYGALASKAPADELLNMSRLIPGAFEKNTARLLDEMLVRIDDTQTKLGKSIDYLDLKPLIARLLQGGAAPSGRKWNVGFDQWAAKTLLADREQAEKSADTAATALEITGLLVATFASGGLALLIGGTLAVGVPIARGISDWSKANELDVAAKATPMTGTDIVAQAQADSLKAKGVGDIIRGVINAITLGGAAVWQTIRGAMTAAKLGRIGELSAAEAADLVEKALGQFGAAKTVASSGKTVEELLTIVGEKATAVGPLRAYNAELMAKPLSEITPAEFAASEALQNRLFNMAQGVQARQQALADRILAKLGIKGGSARSILKRPDLESFAKGVLEKTERKGYERVSTMDDIVRGRFDLPDEKSVNAVVRALKEETEVSQIVAPRPGYPRYHVIVRDAETGLTHEWQVGTEALSKLYETPGISIPEQLAEAAAQLGKKFKPDLHDVEYDLFQAINKGDPVLASQYGIPEFIRKVAQASEKAGAQGAAFKDVLQTTAALQSDASSILARLVEGKGAEWVAQFFH